MTTTPEAPPRERLISADLTGKWSGTFDELNPDGSVRRSGSATQTSANTAGMSRKATKSTSAFDGRFGSSRNQT